jgi:hypothetical protein
MPLAVLGYDGTELSWDDTAFEDNPATLLVALGRDPSELEATPEARVSWLSVVLGIIEFEVSCELDAAPPIATLELSGLEAVVLTAALVGL